MTTPEEAYKRLKEDESGDISRHGKAWGERGGHEEQELLARFLAGWDLKAIAEAHKRLASAVQARLGGIFNLDYTVYHTLWEGDRDRWAMHVPHRFRKLPPIPELADVKVKALENQLKKLDQKRAEVQARIDALLAPKIEPIGDPYADQRTGEDGPEAG